MAVDPLFVVMGYDRVMGRSSYLVKCACGAMFDFYPWSARKRCPGCKKLYVYSRGGIGIFDYQKHVVLGDNGEVIT